MAQVTVENSAERDRQEVVTVVPVKQGEAPEFDKAVLLMPKKLTRVNVADGEALLVIAGKPSTAHNAVTSTETSSERDQRPSVVKGARVSGQTSEESKDEPT